MAASSTIVTTGAIAGVQLQTAKEMSQSKPTTLIEHCDEVLRKAFGDDEETIANSLRGL